MLHELHWCASASVSFPAQTGFPVQGADEYESMRAHQFDPEDEGAETSHPASRLWSSSSLHDSFDAFCWSTFVAKLRQLSSVVFSLCSNTLCYQQEPQDKEYQKPAAWTSLLLGASLLSLALAQLCILLTSPKKIARDWPSP